MSEKVLMPKELTAENGAKGLLTGEFKEPIVLQCSDCCGSGYIDEDIGIVCDGCNGAGDFNSYIPVSWTTIKEIYVMAVKHLTVEPPEKESTK